MPVAIKALNDIYPFEDIKKSEQFYHLLKELKCIVCENQSLYESDATLTKDIKDMIYTKVNAGYSDKEIKAFLTQRYGKQILLKPPLDQSTYLLWSAPILLLFIGIWVGGFLLRKFTSVKN